MKNIKYHLLITCFILALLPAVCSYATTTNIASPVSTINIVSLGADNTGVKDCSALVRKAQEQGNVYFPAGTYLMGPVDVIANRKYYGDGMGKTIIKAKHTKIKVLWGIATFDFDKSGHPKRNIENVEISDMTLDYNLVDGWVNYYSVILFKGTKGNYIRNIKLQRLEFIDNAKVVHPDVTGGSGKDAWSINFSSFADSTANILIDKCVSNAESHQFAGGGGSWLKRVTVTNNYIKNPHANGIAFTTVSDQDVEFADFTVTGNTIIDPFGSAVLFGHDPGTVMYNGGVQTFKGLLVENNKIMFSNYTVYGKPYRTRKSFPYFINLSGAEPYMKDVTVRNNDIEVTKDYNGNDICMGKIRSYTFRRTAINTLEAFKQPAINSNIDIPIATNMLNGKQIYNPGTFVKIAGGGIYEITKVSDKELSLKLTNWEIKGKPGSTVPKGSEVAFIGGKLEDVEFANNRITGTRTLRVIPGGLINDITFKGNNKVWFSMPYANCIIDKAQFNNNTDFKFSQKDGNISGTMSGNKLLREGGVVKSTLKKTTSLDGKIQNNLKMLNNN